MTTSTTEQPDIDFIKEIFIKQKEKSLSLRSEPMKNRLVRLKKLQYWIEKNKKAIQHAVYEDFKKPAAEVDISEVYPCISEIKHALHHLSDWVKPHKVDAPLSFLGSTSNIRYEPRGVCLIISPWNYPFNLAVGPLVSALAAGNTVMMKPSELTPNTSAVIEKMIGELFPEDEVCVFQGGAEMSQELLKNAFDHVFFTGSPGVGKIVMEAASKNLTSVTLELGGKSPVIVDETAHLKDTAEKIAWGKFLNNGQTCVAPDYLLVEKSIKTPLIDQLKAFTQAQYDHKLEGFDKSADYTRIVNTRHFDRLQGLIDEAVNKGAKIEMGGKSNRDDCFIPPTILSDIPEGASLLEEEIFGPVLPVITYESLDGAIDLVNEKPKPLSLYYFGRSRKNREKVLKTTSAGGVCINDCVIQFGHNNLPFGGVNHSGIGKSHGYYGFLTFSNQKPVLKQRVGLTTSKSIYPPYTKTVRKMIDAMIKYF
ncbi:MAG: aldehyde dehydrogenase family protein [Fulvivirga sp.]|nr:aldehyde dehydrogenase family protein [Fulvivirga sp.]